jgi:class 3 adenylate cyclase/tetratricopeptide (TPR) repeat protein
MECGAGLGRACGRCGAELPAEAKFCPACGDAAAAPERDPRDYTPKHLAEKILQSRSALEGERKQVTVVFADVKGSVELAEQVDPEEWHGILDRFFQILTDGVHRFEGTVNQYTGDGIMALFGAPIAHEDHAQRACYAALWLRDELRRYANELRVERGLNFGVRIGLNSGEVVVGKIGDDLRMDYTAQGPTVNLAARMQEIAEPGTPCLAERTAAQTRGYFELEDLGRAAIRGIHEPVSVFALQGLGPLRTRLDLSRARGFSRFVGRADELSALEAALRRTTRGNGQIAGVVGEAGVGKSRLCAEFVERCRANGVAVYEAHCLSHGRTVPFLPILELLRGLLGLAESDRDQVAREKIAGRLLLLDEAFSEALPLVFDFLGIPDPERAALRMDPEVRQRQFFAFVRRLVQARSAQEPTVIFMDDLHWIDAASDELLAQLVEAVPATPTLLLVNFRPEYAAEWTRKSYYEQLPLMPLGAGDVEAMLRELLGSDESVERLSAVIRERTAGNPFFMEELVRSLVEAGVLEGERGAYRRVRVVEDLEVPATVQAVLAARIDRLPEREKRALQTAAIIGQQFTVPLLSAVTELANSDLTAALSALESAEFIFPRSLYPVAEYVFKHPLMEQVARESQLAERRRQLHRAVGRRIEELHADRLPDSWEALAHHFYRGQDWSPAFEYLRKTGDKARAAFANREAVSLYDRAAEAADHLELEAAERAALYEAKGQAHLGLSEFPEAVEAFRRALDLSTVERDRARLQVALATALTWVYEFDAAIAAAEEALAISRAEGDPGTAGIASLIIARVRAIRGDLDGAERSHIDAARFAEASGRKVLATQLHVSEALAANWRGSYRAGIELLEPIVGRAEKENELMVLLEAKSHLAITLGGAGEYGRAISLISDGVALAESIGDKVWRARMWNTRGWILNELGAFEEAEEANVRCLETAQQLSVRIGMFDELTANAEANLADGALWRGDAGAAEPHLAGVAAIANKPRNEWMVWRFGMHCQATACELALDRGDLARARDHLAICLRTARRTRSRRYLVRAIRLLAACHVFAGDFAKAEPLISAAVRRARELGNPPQRWHALLAQGRVLDRLGKHDEAIQTWREARGVAEAVARALPDELRAAFGRSAIWATLAELGA